MISSHAFNKDFKLFSFGLSERVRMLRNFWLMPKKSGQPSSLSSERGKTILREMALGKSPKIKDSSLEERAKDKPKITQGGIKYQRRN
jgi:hypothetical protein